MNQRTWLMRPGDCEYDVDDVYATYKELFTVNVHHFGVFVSNPRRQYVGGMLNAIDLIDSTTFCLDELNEMIREIGYVDTEVRYFYFLKPGSDLDNGLLPLATDSDVRKMVMYIPKFSTFDVFVEHGVTSIETNFGTGRLIQEIDEEFGLLAVGTSRLEEEKGVDCNATNESMKGKSVDCNEAKEADEREYASEDGGDNESEDSSVDGSEDDDSDDNDFEPEKELNEDDDNVLEAETTMDDYEVDMTDFHMNVNSDVQLIGGDAEAGIGELNMDDEVVGMNFEEFDSGDDSENVERRRRLRLKHLRKTNEEDPNQVMLNKFYVGQRFNTAKQVKERVRLHAIETRRNLKLEKNDKLRVRVRCHGFTPSQNIRMTKKRVKKEVSLLKRLGTPEKKGVKGNNASDKGVVGEQSGIDDKDKTVISSPSKTIPSRPTCPWTLHVSKGKDMDYFMVKTLIEQHTCLQNRELKQCSSTFLSKQICDTIVADPGIKASAIQDILSKKFELGITKMTAYKAKSKAKKILIGDFKEQYTRLRDYCLELQKRNPNTTAKIDVHVDPNPSSETRVFKRVYICLGSLKQGFRACRRELLGLDGAFLKGPYPGQLLTAVGVDPNNGIYPLAYAVVEAETFESWTWFLECIGDDLEVDTTSNFTFISDRQKGLIPALAKVFPSAEHRYCLRHIYENMRGLFKGSFIKDLLWKAATRTTVYDFDAAMEELKGAHQGAYNYLKEIQPHHWSRAHFTGRANCDILLNNLCETFNSKLVDGRDKPIISCLEYCREYLMKRIVIVQKVIDKSPGPLTPTVTAIFEGIKKAATKYSATWNGGDRFQVKDAFLDQHVVDLKLRTCTCRKWELTGLPCRHAVASIWDMSLNSVDVGIPEDWVHPAYRLDTWKEVYSFKVEPVSGCTSWPRSNCPTKLLPPFHKNQVGRPKKKRKRSAHENEPIVKHGKLSRVGRTITCGKCGNKGHNSTSCKGQSQVGAGAGASQVGMSASQAGTSQAGVSASEAGTSQAGATQSTPSQVNQPGVRKSNRRHASQSTPSQV